MHGSVVEGAQQLHGLGPWRRAAVSRQVSEQVVDDLPGRYAGAVEVAGEGAGVPGPTGGVAAHGDGQAVEEFPQCFRQFPGLFGELFGYGLEVTHGHRRPGRSRGNCGRVVRGRRAG